MINAAVRETLSVRQRHDRLVLRTLVFIPKKTDKKNYKQFRPISLVSNLFKVGAHVLNDRLGDALREAEAFPGNFHAFIKERNRQDAVRRVVDDITRAFTCGRYLGIVQVDIESAYDCILREYAFDMLDRLGFGPIFLGMLGTLYSKLEAQVLFKGEEGGSFEMTNGLGQGDPLSLLLFAVAMLPLSKAINRTCTAYSGGR